MANNIIAYAVPGSGHIGSKNSTAGTTFTLPIDQLNVAHIGDVGFIVVVVPSATVSVSTMADGSNSYNRVNSLVNGALTLELWTTTFVAVGSGLTVTITLSATGTLANAISAAFRNVRLVGTSTTVTGSVSPITSGAQNLSQQGNSFLLFAGGVAGVTTFPSSVGTIIANSNVTGASSLLMNNLPNIANPVTDSATMGTPTTWAGIYLEVDGFVAPAEGTKITRNWFQETNSTNGTTLSITATGAQSVDKGDLIVVIWRTTQKGGTITLSDNKNAGNYQNAYLQDETSTNTGELGCYFMPNSIAVAAGQLIVTITTTITAFIYLGVLVYHGADPNPFDGAVSVAYFPATVEFGTSGPITPTVSDDLAVGSFSLPSASTNTLIQEALGFTSELVDNLGTGGFAHCHSGDRIMPDSSVVEYFVNISATNNTPIFGLALFKPLALDDTFVLTGQYQLR